MENEKIAENILRDKCCCAKQKALSGVNHICFVCEFTKALNAKDTEIAKLEAQVAKYREVLTIISDDMTCDAITLAKQALEDTPKEDV